MKVKTFDVRGEGSQEYAALTTYIIDYSTQIAIEKRPLILVCPGGGYSFTSDREAEMIALQFLSFGYHAAVLRYSCAPSVYPAALKEVGRSMKILREHSEEWHVDPDKIGIIGFSAGGHLTANYCMFWNQPWLAESLGTTGAMLKPNAMVLGYPVITSGPFAHEGSFRNLLAEEYDSKKEEFSLENCVNEDTPKAFVWHTFGDHAVPVQNSLLLVSALVAHGIPVEYHVFEKGEHGLSLANRLTSSRPGADLQPAAEAWMSLLHTWLEVWAQE